jgi:hypothetical protein
MSAKDFPESIEGINSYVGRENFGNDRKIRSIEVNNYWISKINPNEKFEAVFLGSSRTKYLRPNSFFKYKSLVIGGNSYGEISYGPLVEAEIVRARFPDIRKYYFESSFLHRKCGFFSQQDHKKYSKWLGRLREFWGAYQPPETELAHSSLKSQLKTLVAGVQNYKISKILFPNQPDTEWKKFLRTELEINEFGEYPVPKFNEIKADAILPAIQQSNAKVDRILNSKACVPGDHLFESIVEWGKHHGLEIVFYQPPVRSDLLEFKINNGLAAHTSHLKKLAEKNQIRFIDLNYSSNPLSQKWSYFSDEDHLNTCFGSLIFTQALLYSNNDRPNLDQYMQPSNLASFCRK